MTGLRDGRLWIDDQAKEYVATHDHVETFRHVVLYDHRTGAEIVCKDYGCPIKLKAGQRVIVVT